MVTKFGMSDSIGPINYVSDSDEIFIGRDFVHSKDFSEKVSAKIDDEVHTIISDCYKKCIAMIEKNRDKLENVAKELMEKEKISGEEFEKIYASSEKTDDTDTDVQPDAE